MALSRRSGHRMAANVWPGFVDAMTALLLVLMFVLTIFMIMQFVLSETITGQETELDDLTLELTELARALGVEQQRSFSLDEQVATLGTTLDKARSDAQAQAQLIANLTLQTQSQGAELAARQAQITSFEAQVASLLAQRETAQTQAAQLSASVKNLETQNTQLTSEQAALELALAGMRDEIDAQTQAARLAAARRDALDALVLDLRDRVAEQDLSLAQTLAQLDTSVQQVVTLDQAVSELQTTISDTEAARLAEAAAAEVLRARLQTAQTALTQEEKIRLAEAAAAEALRERLLNADDELTAMTLALEQQRQDAEDTLTLIAAAKALENDLNSRLSAALLAQETLQSRVQSAQSDQSETALTLAAAQENLAAALAERDALKAQLETTGQDGAELASQLAQTNTDLAAALAEKFLAQQQADTQMSAAEQRAALLSIANSALATEEAKSAESQRKLALLNEQVAALRAQLGSLQAILKISEDRDISSQVELTNLGSRLNTALARVASEESKRAELEAAERKRLELQTTQLAGYKSEFFGQLRGLLGDREGVRIVGDRFVFSSEVLFEPASVDLVSDGKAQIGNVAALLAEVSGSIPSQIDWVIRVDGHTDNTVLSGTGRYRNNWELSQARALSVVQYMIDELGFPANRLAATGFGEFQPLAQGDSPEALAQNRRIELKLTER
ncbi:MAG: peptidoglycan -binding protein [Paracoccaceae bacterium]